MEARSNPGRRVVGSIDLDDEVEPFKPLILPLYPPLAFSSNKKFMDRRSVVQAVGLLYTRIAPSARCATSIPRPAKVRFHGSFALFDANASPSRDEDEEITVSSKVPMPIVVFVFVWLIFTISKAR